MPGLEGLSEQKSEGFRQKENMLCTDFNIGTKHMQVVFIKLLWMVQPHKIIYTLSFCDY